MNNLVQIKNLSVGFQSHNKKSNVVKSISLKFLKEKQLRWLENLAQENCYGS